MRKTLALLLVAAMAVGSAFAAFSGEASIGFGANFDNGNYGFIDNGANVKFDLDLATASAESIAEGDIYASIKATLALKLTTGEKSYADGDLYKKDRGFGIIADITEAKVAGESWYVSILGLPDAPNYASSAIDTYTVEGNWDKYGLAREDYDKNANYGLSFTKATGVEVGVADYVVGFGLLGDYSSADTWKFQDNLKVAAYFQTPEYDINGLTLQAGAVYSYSAFDSLNDDGVVVPSTKGLAHAFGVSAKAAYANDTISASVATDLGYDIAAEKFGTDVAANFTYDFLSVDAYYATKAVTGEEPKHDPADPTATDKFTSEHLLSAQVKADLTTLEVPVSVTVALKDIIAKQALSVSTEITAVENLTLTVKGGYTFDADGRDTQGAVLKDNEIVGKWNAGLEAEYVMDICTVNGAFSIEQKLDSAKNVIMGASASVESESLIPGATVKLAWANAKDFLGKDADKTDFGKITASCAIEF